MSFFKYLIDKRYFIFCFILIMGFIDAVFYLDPLTTISRSNIQYVNLFALLIVVIYLLVDFLRIRSMLKGISEQEINPFHKLSKSLDNEHRIYFDFLKQAYEKVENEKTLLKLEKKEYSEFIEKWVHEIKTPISVIALIAEKEGSIPEEVSESITEELKRISENVDRALYYSKLDSFNQDYFIEKTDVYRTAKDVIKSTAQLFIRKKIAIEISDDRLMVSTDKKWLHFIVYQIISNALKYTDEGGRITLSHVEETHDYIFSITDTGCGIRPEDIGRIFNKGFTGYNGRQDPSATGVGLYISKKLADKLNLKLTAESVSGGGTTIKIRFPKANDFFNVTEL
ncbi:MAG TPA: sensor histidine kinase [Thermotogota bacterium]|nr:sensor histidine kinase [Thermotogota bacterium]